MKEKINWWSVIKYAGAFIAFMIGSGFASGQEIMQFFTSYGIWSIGGVLISMFLFSWSGAVLMQHGYDTKDAEKSNSFHYYCGKILGTFFDIFVPCFLFAVVVVMVSGAGATISQYYHLPQWVGSAAMALLAVLSVMLGLQKLIDIIGCLGPFTIIFTIVIAVVTLLNNGGNLAEASAAAAQMELPQAAASWWIAGLLYVAYNVTGAVPFLTAMGAGANSRKEAKWGAIAGGVALMLAGLLLNLAMLCDIEEVAALDIPILHLANYISPVFGVIFSVILLGEIFSTAAPMLWVTANKLGKEGTMRHKLIVLALGAVAFFAGQLPFGQLVSIVYPYTGYMGVLMLIIIAVKTYIIERRNKA